MLFLSGCMLINDVKSLPDDFIPQKNQAIVIYGVGLEAAWKAPKFKITLNEYNIEDQTTTGGCTFYNRMEATIPSISKNIEYFAFKVPSGYYTYSGFNAGLNSKKEMDTFISSIYQAPKTENYVAYGASKNKITYIGDFIFIDAGYVVLHRDLEKARINIKKKFPNLKQNIELADFVSISQPEIFLCTP